MTELFTTKEFKPISPLLESAAYEALYDKQGQSFKTLAEQFASAPGSLPSDLVDPETIEIYKEKILSFFNNEKFGRIGVRVNNSYEYPSRLRDAKHPIEVIYYIGDWDLIHTKSIAVVGTRNPSDNGIRRAKMLSHQLVKKGYTVASGLAKGIDRVAHLSAIASGGKTIAVLGTPITENYPKENSKLQEFISRHHLLISQVPFVRYSHEPFNNKRIYFPERNKLMSALSEATVIVEAGETSGTLVQARAAIEQGRKVYILDSNFNNPKLTWPHRFLEKGAIRLKDIEDVDV